MMVKGFDDDVEWSALERKKKKGAENSIRVRMHHQLFQFPNSISSAFYLLYADSLKVLSLSLGIAPDRLLHRSPGLQTMVLVLFVDREEKKKLHYGKL